MKKNIIKQMRFQISRMSVSAKASIAYIIVSLVTKGLAFVTLPLFTRLMSTEEIGLVSIYYSWFSICSEVFTLGMLSGGFNVAMSKFGNLRNSYSSSVYTLILIITSMASVALILFKDLFLSISSLPVSLFYLMLVGLVVTPANNIWLIQSRYEYKYKKVCAVSIVQAGTATLFSLVAVVIAAKNKSGCLGEVRLYSQNLVQYSFALFFAFLIIKRGKTFYSKKFWIFSLSLGLPLIVHQIAGEVLSTSDRIMIGKMINNSSVGIYTTLFSLCTVGSIIWNGINSSLVPFLYENINKEDKRESLSYTVLMALLVYGLFVTLIVLCAPEIVLIMATREYLPYVHLIPFFSVSVFCTAISNIYSNVIIYYQKSQYIMISTLIAAGVNVVLNYFLIKLLDVYGAAISTAISSIIMVVIQIYITHKIYADNVGMKLPFNERSVYFVFLLMIFISAISLVLYKMTAFRYIVVMVLLFELLKHRKRFFPLFVRKI